MKWSWSSEHQYMHCTHEVLFFVNKLLFLELYIDLYVQTCKSDWIVGKLSWFLPLSLVHSDFIISPISEVAPDTASNTWRVMQWSCHQATQTWTRPVNDIYLLIAIGKKTSAQQNFKWFLYHSTFGSILEKSFASTSTSDKLGRTWLVRLVK